MAFEFIFFTLDFGLLHCKVKEGREEGVQSQILKKNRSKYFVLKKIMTNS